MGWDGPSRRLVIYSQLGVYGAFERFSLTSYILLVHLLPYRDIIVKYMYCIGWLWWFQQTTDESIFRQTGVDVQGKKFPK